MTFFECMFGPRLYKDYENYVDFEDVHQMPVVEKVCNFILTVALTVWDISVYSLPFIAIFRSRHGNVFTNLAFGFLKLTTLLGIIGFIAMCIRAIARLQCESYQNLISALKLAKSPRTADEGKMALKLFDFDFRWWPIDFDMQKIRRDDRGESAKIVLDQIAQKFGVIKLPQYIAGYLVMHSFGIRMLYPGCIKTLQNILHPILVNGRAKLVMRREAKRYKLRTADGNIIDTIFLDCRSKSQKGLTLIISSEGNLSFYEIGIGTTAVGRIFSVLGWNHPGFAGSTGKPYPEQEMNAIDAVIQFATRALNFKLNDIILYGWSIGGFSTVCGASKFHNLKGIILDGAFDDVVHLAVLRFPNAVSSLIEVSVRGHCNLNVAELLKKYDGPVLIIRRTYDETIAQNNHIETNRTNFLAMKLLQFRYPNIFQDVEMELVQNILSKPFVNAVGEDSMDSTCLSHFMKYVKVAGTTFPMLIGENFIEEERMEMAQFLLRKHFRDFRSSHCPLLPLEQFQMPWSLPIEAESVN